MAENENLFGEYINNGSSDFDVAVRFYQKMLKGKRMVSLKNGMTGTVEEVYFEVNSTLNPLFGNLSDRISCRMRFDDGHYENFRLSDLEKAYDEEDLQDKKDDPVNHPSHYTDGKYEVIDFIESTTANFHLGNAIKYIARAGKKDPSRKKEDLEKALWYTERYLSWSRDPIPKAIPLEAFLEDKGLANTPQGLALELLLGSKPEMAVKALKVAIRQEEEE